MATFCDSKFDEYDNETANIIITIDPVRGCSIKGYTNTHYVNPYDGNEKNEPYDYHYHFEPEKFQALTNHIRVDYPSYFSEQTADTYSLTEAVTLVIKEEFDFSASIPGRLHKYADFYQIQHMFKMQ